MFKSAADSAFDEISDRRTSGKSKLTFGIPFLDIFAGGIRKNDLILIGAPSGVGKTELCCSIALANMANGKKVHYIALEAEKYEIERRLKYQLIANAYHMAPLAIKPKLHAELDYDTWENGDFLDELKEIEAGVADLFSRGYKDLFVLYKEDKFDVSDLIENVSLNASSTDLIIVDHVHYFDFDDKNESSAIKDIAMTARNLALEEGKPIILVSHLRKRDKFNQELCAGLDEFHGSSDLFKVATKVITLSPGSATSSGNFETFVRVPKNRKKGAATRYLGRLLYSPKNNSYAKEFKVGISGLTRTTGFEELAPHLLPAWART